MKNNIFRILILVLVITISLTFMVLGTSGCMNSAAQTIVTISTAVETATSETAAPTSATTAPIVKETVQEDKIPSNFELVYIPKIDGVPWFKLVQKGLEQCASDYGFKVTIVAPPKADPGIQEQIVLDYMGKGIDALAVCPIADKTMDIALGKASSSGILTFSNEGYNLKNVIFDLEAMSSQAFGEAIMQAGVKYTGGTGKYIVSVGLKDSTAHNQWADAEISWQQKNSAGLVNALGYTPGSDRFEDGEDNKTAAEKLTGFTDSNQDLNLIVGNSISTGIAAGELISKKKLKGKLMFVGTGMPITIGNYILDDILQEGFFWDPYLIGYALGYTAFKTWSGEDINQGASVSTSSGAEIPGYQSLGVQTNSNGGKIIFGNAVESISKENIESWYQKFESYGWPQK